MVSTHSRPKAAGHTQSLKQYHPKYGFNTQPPEGGWPQFCLRCARFGCFNTQPPEGGWISPRKRLWPEAVSTHSRPKAAGTPQASKGNGTEFQHTAARRRLGPDSLISVNAETVSTHSRPKAAGSPAFQYWLLNRGFQHTAARRRLVFRFLEPNVHVLFQHTAARRRLAAFIVSILLFQLVSTHSRPKAAGLDKRGDSLSCFVSTHSRPKAAGFRRGLGRRYPMGVSTHSRPKAAGAIKRAYIGDDGVSTHSRPKAAGSFGFDLTVQTTVSTHSRPKAAGSEQAEYQQSRSVSTHSRPKAAG